MTSQPTRRLIAFSTLFALAAAGWSFTPATVINAKGAQGAQGAVPQTVDFVALTTDGSPITDLTANQVALKVGGKDRALTSLELVRFDAAASLLPAPFATNSAADAGRDFVLVVDEDSLRTGMENPLRDALLAFSSSLAARDRIGLFTVPRGSTSLAPTTDRGQFRAAVAAIKGRSSTAAGTDSAAVQASTAGCHGRDVLAALSSIVTATSRPAGLTPVVLFSGAIAAPDTTVSSMAMDQAAGRSVLQSQECKLTQREFQVLGQAVDAARSPFYVVRPEAGAEGGRSEGLENVTGVTGGQMFALGGATDGAMARIARETSAYYVATFTAEAAERNGASHRLELRSSRADVVVRARAGVVIPRPERGGALTPQSMLRTAVVQRGFGLRATAVVARNDGDTKNPVKLLGLAEPTDPTVKISAAAAGIYDPTGKLIAQWTARPEELQRSPMAAAMAIPGGTYRFRVAAVDTQGRAATTDYEVNTELTSAGVATMGSLLVGTATTGFMPQLQFTTEAEVMVYFELYGRPTGPFGALVEIADTVDGPALVSAQPVAAATPIQDKFMFTVKLPIAGLKPGDYVVRAKLAFEGQPTGVLMRTIRKK